MLERLQGQGIAAGTTVFEEIKKNLLIYHKKRSRDTALLSKTHIIIPKVEMQWITFSIQICVSMVKLFFPIHECIDVAILEPRSANSL